MRQKKGAKKTKEVGKKNNPLIISPLCLLQYDEFICSKTFTLRLHRRGQIIAKDAQVILVLCK